MILIGLCGRKRSGKGSIAEALAIQLGFTRYAFGAKLKELQKKMFPWIPDDAIWGQDREALIFRPPVKMVDLGAPHEVTSRHIQQALGQGIRAVIGENAWINAVVDQINEEAVDKVVIEDIRQPNELNCVRESGGKIIRVNRADRLHFHHFQGEGEACTYEFRVPDRRPAYVPIIKECSKSRDVHPTSWTYDDHETEWALPDESLFYDRIINASSGEEAAELGVQFAKMVMP